MNENRLLSGLSSLNYVQRCVVEAPEQHLLVFAGAGSGKTRVLTHRIAYLIGQRQVSPYQIMAVTFTNKAAGELKSRLALLAGDHARSLSVGTFHAICARILRRDIHHLGYDSRFTIYDEDDQLALIKQALKQLNVDEKHFSPRSILGAISRFKSHLERPLAFPSRAGSYFEEIAHRTYAAYQELLARNNALDFDDLLLHTLQLFEEYPDVLEAYRRRYRHILVDEFQDTNPPQYRFIQLLGQSPCHVLVVGDDDQSIYRFRGAEVGNILSFEQNFPGVQVFRLEQNYRSTGHIVGAAQAVIERVSARAAKKLWTALGDGEPVSLIEVFNEQEESSLVAREIRRLQARELVKLGQCAVLYRTNAQSRTLEETFLREGIRYQLVGGTRFYDRKEVRDVLAYVRLVNNPSDTRALERVINVPPRNFGLRTVAQLVAEAAARNIGLASMLAHASEISRLSPRATRSVTELARLLQELTDAGRRLPVPDLLMWICERTGYASFVQDGTGEGQERWQNVLELQSVASEFAHLEPAEGLEQFLEQVSLVAATDDMDDGDEAVTLLTLHAAKGLEFDAVFMVGMEEGLFPHSRTLDRAEELEEERRLCYVGMTRAKHHLYLISALRRTLYGSTLVNEPSRFIREIPAEHVRRLGTALETSISRAVDTAPSHSSRAERQDLERQRAPQSNGRPSIIAQLEARRASTATTPQPGRLRYHEGDHVHHKLFGDGVVVNSSVRANEEEVIVDFPHHGRKKLAASFAPMVKV
ncbi:MAG: UvrD-helicase domain-containing protein [Chloroflexi bacterium]|nr:UvrD-helicase domain-containing protein [Chloroflexota bacterium]